MRKVIIHEGTKDEKRALFHCWGFSCGESDNGNMTESVAIIEFDDGSVTTIPPHYIKFVIPEMKK